MAGWMAHLSVPPFRLADNFLAVRPLAGWLHARLSVRRSVTRQTPGLHPLSPPGGQPAGGVRLCGALRLNSNPLGRTGGTGGPQCCHESLTWMQHVKNQDYKLN